VSDDDIPPPTDEERREAEALANALDARSSSSVAPPDDALAAAALLRTSHADGTLAPERQAALRKQLESSFASPSPSNSNSTSSAASSPTATTNERRHQPAWARRRTVIFALSGLCAAVLLIVLVRNANQAAPPRAELTATLLPEPPRALLEAQVRATHERDAQAGLETQMEQYRPALYAALQRRYARSP
jgi:hypothetical protein